MHCSGFTVVPKARKIESQVFSFVSDARLDGRTLRIRRELVSRVAGQVCAPALEAEIAGPLKSVAAAVQAKLVMGKPASSPLGSAVAE